MLNLYRRYVRETHNAAGQIESYDLVIPESFNFAFDVMDEIAAAEPERRAMLWCNEAGDRKTFTFADFKRESDRCASYFQSIGICKGDRVLLILKRHYQFWFSILALHKIGAVAIPATNQLLAKDLLYRLNAAEISADICTPDGDIASDVEEAETLYGRS